MLGLILSVGEKVLILFLMIAVGAIAARRKILTREGASQLAELVLLVSTPCVIIAAFTRDMDQVTIPELLFMTAAAAVVHFLFILCARIFFPKEPTTRQKTPSIRNYLCKCRIYGTSAASKPAGEYRCCLCVYFHRRLQYLLLDPRRSAYGPLRRKRQRSALLEMPGESRNSRIGNRSSPFSAAPFLT